MWLILNTDFFMIKLLTMMEILEVFKSLKFQMNEFQKNSNDKTGSIISTFDRFLNLFIEKQIVKFPYNNNIITSLNTM